MHVANTPAALSTTYHPSMFQPNASIHTHAVSHANGVQQMHCNSRHALCFRHHGRPATSKSVFLLCLMQMVCSRCTATADMTFASDAVASGNQHGRAGNIQMSTQCLKCHQDWSASLTPRCFSESAGYQTNVI